MTVIAQDDHLTPVVQFYCLWKINSCLSTPNDTRNRVLPTNKTKEYYNGNIFFLRVTSNLLLISFPSCIRISPFFYLFSFSFSSSLEVIASLVTKPFLEYHREHLIHEIHRIKSKNWSLINLLCGRSNPLPQGMKWLVNFSWNSNILSSKRWRE